jgi:hypothetical protein
MRVVAWLLLGLPIAASQMGAPHLKPGEQLPTISGKTPSGRQLDLPADAGERPAVLLFSFSRAGGRDGQSWSEQLARTEPHVAVFNVICLESVPRLFRGMAEAGIKSGMPAAIQNRSVLLYHDANLWRQRLGVSDENSACEVLLGLSGQINWSACEKYSDAGLAELVAKMRAAHLRARAK